MRDMRRGVVRKAKVSASLIPENSVANAINFDFDVIIGSAVSRFGTTPKGGLVASNRAPLGLTSFINATGSLNLIIAGYMGVTSASLYYFDTAWHVSNITNWNNTKKIRFASLAGYTFAVNGVEDMRSTVDGATWGTDNCIPNTVKPSLIFRAKNRLLAAGDATYPDRVWFSKIVDPTTNPALTWDVNLTTGDWIDVNPDDGDNVTGFSEVSNLVLIFKSRGIYRLNVITKTVDTENLFDVGAYSQEAIVPCLGKVFFYSGKDIRVTDGGFPNQISRLGVQDWLDAIPEANKADVTAGRTQDGVYFSIGDITLEGKNYKNVTLKYSALDESWTVYTYRDHFTAMSNYVDPVHGFVLIGADTDGNVQMLDVGDTDNGEDIFVTLESQEIEFGNRAHWKTLSEQFIVFAKNGMNSSFQVRPDDGNFKPLLGSLNERVNQSKKINVKGHFFTFLFTATTKTTRIIYEGFQIENVTDNGLE